jgi:tetratricopeptide (TPR) repeat protein
MVTDESDEDGFEREWDEFERLSMGAKPTEVIALCEELAQRFPGHFEVYFRRAHARYRTHQTSAAVADLSTAIALQPKEAALFFFRGLWTLGQGHFSDAVQDLSQAIAIEQSDGTAYYVESAQFARAVGALRLRDFSACLRDCASVRPDMTCFVGGRVWTVEEVREQALGAG